uniref:Uncharacterized protein AlNc14C321G10589 n=1 Tax=Albugo laibachii Nc14 TaxID=890382 RepID=F0WWF5_9STRA|nr:conserved hypothetical protein [Albugo laibachii Nc14]|eukprot:CCA25778.1 conserved hypothetical protein [Albugo laibachii Nc14]
MSDYYSIHEILAGEERVNCTFQTDAQECAYLDPSSLGDDIKAGSEVDLPLWLATTLIRRDDVNVQVPQYFTRRFSRMLKAGPSAVNLSNQCFYLYQVGKELLPLVESDESTIIEKVLRHAFGGERYREILYHSMSAMWEDSTEFTRKLTHEEKQILTAGAADFKDMIRWKSGGSELLTAAPVLAHITKRLRAS